MRGRSVGHVGVAAGLAALALPLTFSESKMFSAGLVLIAVVAATGLHVLVNWAGELSLAHAGMVGLPAFLVARWSAAADISPVVVMPAGVLVGAAVGAAVGIPALRAKGLQVALLTLAAGIAIDRFFFTKDWVVAGTGGGVAVPTPRVGPLTLTSTRDLYLFVAAVTAAVVAAAYVLYRSKLARALWWIKQDPAAASAFGIPVRRYRVLAYAAAGAFAGVAGGLNAVYIGRLTPLAFPLSLSFTYLVIVVLAGNGFLGGVVAAAVVLEGGRLFVPDLGAVIAYGGPLSLIFILTRYTAGLNGLGRSVMDLSTSPADPAEQRRPGLELIAGWLCVAAGLIAIGVAWYHTGNTDEVWIQNQEIVSGGIGGLALVVVGVGLLIRDGLRQNRAELISALRRLGPDGDEPLEAIDLERTPVGPR
jgi:branched-chain amino acid transport system permease protein